MKPVLAACLCAFAMQANAAWIDDEIEEIVNNVRTVRNTVQGNVATTANDLKRQLDDLKSKGVLITSSVEEILTWLQNRTGPFNTFKGGNCGAGTPCADFRGRLKRFTGEISSLADRFPAVEKVGLGDGVFAEGVIDILPPFVLFAMHEVMDRVAGWEDIPLDLIDVFDEIDDAEAFSIDFFEAGTATRQAAGPVRLAGAQQSPTDRFCSKRADRVKEAWDPVRLNRIKSAGFALRTAVNVWSEFAVDQVGGSLIGEGVYGIKMPVRAVLKGITGLIEVIQFQVETYRQNLGICRDRLRESEAKEQEDEAKAQARLREIETHLVSCAQFAEYKRQEANDEVYAFVEAKVEEFGTPFEANRYLKTARDARNLQQWSRAYRNLCLSYQALAP